MLLIGRVGGQLPLDRCQHRGQFGMVAEPPGERADLSDGLRLELQDLPGSPARAQMVLGK